MWDSIRRIVNYDHETERICHNFVVHPFLLETLVILIDLNSRQLVFVIIKTQNKCAVGYNSLSSSFEGRVVPHRLFWLGNEAYRLKWTFYQDE